MKIKKMRKQMLLASLFAGSIFSMAKIPSYALDTDTSEICRMSIISNLGSVKIKALDGNTYTVAKALQMNNCEDTKKYNFYNNLWKVFFRTPHGETVSYQHIPQADVRELTGREVWDWSQNYENHKLNNENGSDRKYFKYWGVPMNTLNCSSSYNGEYGEGCGNKLETAHSHFRFFMENGIYQHSGGNGEPRYIGYSENGTSIENSYLPLDTNGKFSSLAAFPYDENIFATGKNHWFTPTKTRYDNDDAMKTFAINQLLKQYPELANKGGKDYWWNRLSLQSNPYTEAPVFKTTRNNGNNYMIITLPTPDAFNRNVSLVKMELMGENPKGDICTHATMTRNDNESNVTTRINKTCEIVEGNTYDVKITVKNTSGSLASLTGANYLDVTTGTETEQMTDSSKSDLGYKDTYTFTYKYTAPEGKTEDTIKASIGDGYNSDGKGNNQETQDDHGMLNVMITSKPTGDLIIGGAQLIEASTGKSVTYPIQGMEYYIKYQATYKGDTMPDLFDIDLKAVINTYKPNQNGDGLLDYATTTTLDSTPNVTELTSKGATLEFVTETFTATSSQIKTDYEIVGPKYDLDYNTNKDNDAASAEFAEKFNVTIKPGSIVIQPGNHDGNGEYCKPIVVKYEAMFTAPPGHNYKEAQTIEVAINIGGKIQTTTIQVYANQGYQEYSFTFNGDCVDLSVGTVPVEIILNPFHELYESISDPTKSAYDDNRTNTTWNKKTYDQNYCETHVNTENKWDQRYHIISVNQAALSPTLDQYKDTTTKDIRQSESLKITSAQFYSKYMKDMNMGEDGWLELIDSNGNYNGKKPTIKAGYAFDVKVTVEYETDAFTTERNGIGTLASNETLYAPHATSSIEDDFYLSLKSATASDVVIAATGGNNQLGTEIEVTREVTGDETDKMTFTYTFSNVKIGENTADGTYNLALYTKPVVGVVDKTDTKLATLCAALNVPFDVKGSVYDDIVTGTIQ